MLGPPLEVFKGNKATLIATVAIYGLIASVFCAPAVTPVFPPGFAIYVGILLSPLVLIGGWLLSIKVQIHPDGISYHSWFASKEVRLDELERLYYSSVKRSVNFIPIGTYYQFKLVDSNGNKLSFGNRVERPGVLGQKLIQHTLGPLLNKAARSLQSGQEADFGPIRASREHGLKVKKSAWLGLKSRIEEIPWDQVAEYRIEKGHFFIFRVGQKRATGHPISQVPNAFVLLALLDNIYKPAAAATG